MGWGLLIYVWYRGVAASGSPLRAERLRGIDAERAPQRDGTRRESDDEHHSIRTDHEQDVASRSEPKQGGGVSRD